MVKKILATIVVFGLISSGTAAFAAEQPSKATTKLSLEQRAAKYGVTTEGLSKKNLKAAVQAAKESHKAAKAAKKAAKTEKKAKK